MRVTPATVTVETIRQSVFFVDQKQKLRLLTHWLQETPWKRTLVFTRTKHGADKVAKSLVKAGIQADAFHSNKSQSARQRVLLRFKAPQPLVLVATDIAARGLDIDDVSHVVNFDLPIDADNYIHRIGRTGRAARRGSPFRSAITASGRPCRRSNVSRGKRWRSSSTRRAYPYPLGLATGCIPLGEQSRAGRRPRHRRGRGTGGDFPTSAAGRMFAGEDRSERCLELLHLPLPPQVARIKLFIAAGAMPTPAVGMAPYSLDRIVFLTGS